MDQRPLCGVGVVVLGVYRCCGAGGIGLRDWLSDCEVRRTSVRVVRVRCYVHAISHWVPQFGCHSCSSCQSMWQDTRLVVAAAAHRRLSAEPFVSVSAFESSVGRNWDLSA